jgi:hypothetical protein
VCFVARKSLPRSFYQLVESLKDWLVS